MLPAINPLKDPRRYYGQQADTWMLGCIIFNMVTGVPPFFADLDKEEDSVIFKKIRDSQWREKLLRYHEKASDELLAILEACFIVDPDERI